MSESDLSDLARLAEQLPEERRRELKDQLPSPLNPRFAAGVAEGLHKALQIAGPLSEEAARVLRETAAVAAALALETRRAYEEARRLDTPTARAEIEAELERIQSGQVTMYPFEEVLRDLDAAQADWEAKQAGKTPGAA